MSEKEKLSPELRSICEFIHQCLPFDELDELAVEGLAASMEVVYHRKGHIIDANNDEGGLRIIRSGAAELRLDDDTLVDRFGERVSFNLTGLRQEQPSIRAVLIEDSLIYFLPENAYQSLRSEHRSIDRFFHSQRSRRVRRGGMTESNSNELMRQVSDVMSKSVLSVEPNYSIKQTAKLMTERRVSSVLVMQGDQLLGIVTDRDMRSRAVSQALDYSRPIADIMTTKPQGIDEKSTVFDATLFMTQLGFHHVPVMSDERVVGIVTSSDLMLARKNDPVYLVQHIGRQTSLDGLKATVNSMPDLMVQWVHAGIGGAKISRILTAVSDAVTQRLIKLFIEREGEAPVSFCWLGFGSQGRAEQLLGGDQDNALLISDEVEEHQLGWYERLSHWVCGGLNHCGYVYCPGEIMATTDQWRLPLAQWKETVTRWTRSPTPDAVMRVSIFFDIRCIHGDTQLCASLQQHMLQQASSNTIFLAALAENVLDNTPPLGIFRQFVVDRNGEHQHELNLKKRGVLPIVDLVRIHALANSLTAVNTIERLEALAACKSLTIGDSRNLQDALRVIQQTRIQSQVRQLVSGQSPDNYVNPEELTKLVRKNLRDAFSIVADAQQTVKLRYRGGL